MLVGSQKVLPKSLWKWRLLGIYNMDSSIFFAAILSSILKRFAVNKESNTWCREQHMMQRTHFKSEHEYYDYENRLAAQYTHNWGQNCLNVPMILKIYYLITILSSIYTHLKWSGDKSVANFTSKLYPTLSDNSTLSDCRKLVRP